MDDAEDRILLRGSGTINSPSTTTRVAHNSFVHTFAELGLLGAFCFVGMFYWYFKGLKLIPIDTPESASWRRALMASAVGVLTCAWFLSRQYVPIFYVLLGVGACAATINVPPEKRDEAATRRRSDYCCHCVVDDRRTRARVCFDSNAGGVGIATAACAASILADCPRARPRRL